MTALLNYFEALERLKINKPTKVAVGTKITNDSVSIEAGRSKGSIKKSRPGFQVLIDAIDLAAEEQSKQVDAVKIKVDGAETRAAQFLAERDAALAREISLLRELYALKKELAALSGANVLPIRVGSKTPKT